MKKVSISRYISYLLVWVMLISMCTNGVAVQAAVSNPCTDLIISEYIEGGSSNKAIELYNGTDDPINLNNYKLVRYSNGGTSGTNITFGDVNLASGDVFVIVNGSAADDFKTHMDLESGSVSHNGNDAYELYNGSNLIDSFGKVGEDPGSKWSANGVDTANMTLVRKAEVVSGDINSGDEFDPSVQWTALPQDTFTELGSHTMDNSVVVIPEVVANVTSSVAAGEVTSGTMVELSTTTAGAKIYYTTDESDPIEGVNEYTAAIEITADTTIKAIATKTDATDSAISTFAYTIEVVVPPVDPPVVGSLTVAEAFATARGEIVTVEGYIVAPFNENYAVVIMDDPDADYNADGAVYLYVKLKSDERDKFSPNLDSSALKRKVTIVGERDAYFGEESLEYLVSMDFVEEAKMTDLIISEYVEGSSSNKAIEIYNGTGAVVDLSAYTLKLFSNGSSEPKNPITLSGTLADGECYVIYNSGADAEIIALGDVSSSVTYFNGNDDLVLYKGDVVVDSFGQVGFDPDPFYEVNGVKTQDKTLRRKITVLSGDTIIDDAFDPSLEWDMFDQNNIENLGEYTSDAPVDPPVDPPVEDYYAGTEGLSGDALKAFLNDLIDGHTVRTYSEAYNDLMITDKDPNNSNNVILFYTGESKLATDKISSVADGWNREHTWAKSHGDFGTAMGPGTDLHQLRPTDSDVNNSRNHYDFTELDETADGVLLVDETTDCYVTYFDDIPGEGLFEPREEVKGDVARILFYMATRYEGEDDDYSTVDLELSNSTYTYGETISGVYGEHGVLDVLLQWHTDDPVDAFEISRNEAIFGIQENRNPFIDHPEFVALIWGGDTVEPVDTSITHVKEASDGTTDLFAEGIVTYVSGKNVYIQDEVDAICIRLTEDATTLKVGDLVVAKGTRGSYYNLIQLSDVIEAEVLVKSSDNLPPVTAKTAIQTILATPDGKTPGFDYMCEFVTIEEVVITNDKLLSQNGFDLPLYPAIDLASYADVEVGTIVNVVVRVNDFKGDIQGQVISLQLPEPPLTIKEVLELPADSEDVTVIGQIAYFATSYGNPVIQSIIDGEIYSLYVFGSAPNGAKVGDVVKLTGKYTIYNGLPELMSIVSSTIVSTTEPAMDPVVVTLKDLNDKGLNMLGRFVKIENVELGVYNGSGGTPIKDAEGSSSIYKATEYPVMVEAGDVVDLYAMVACFKSSVQLYTGTPEDNGFSIYDITNDTKAPMITLPAMFLDAKALQDYIISVDVADNKGIDKVSITYTINGVTVSDKIMNRNLETGKYEVVIPALELTAEATSMTFIIEATDVSALTSTTDEQTVAVVNKPEFASVKPARNTSTGDDKAPTIVVSLTNAGESPTVTLTLEKDDVIILDSVTMNSTEANTFKYITTSLDDAKYKATVTVVRADGQSNVASWNFYVGESQFTAYFGQFHAHTAEYSDGSGTMLDALNYLSNIPESDNVDFISFTDHSNYFDSKTSANPAEAMNDKSLMTAESLAKWSQYTSMVDTYNATNEVSKSALAGFEMTWSGGPGHINTFNSDGLVSRNNTALNSKSSDSGLKAYYETLIQNTDSLANLSQFNHPGKTFGSFADFAYWTPAYDNKMVMVEVGNGEGAIGSGGYFTSYSEYTKALDKGWHVAPSNNQDNHKGKWGNANTARTVILTDDFSETGILTAMKNMSIYTTEDKNLNISYTVNDLIMGSIISEIPSLPLQFSINVDDEDISDVIARIEVVTNGGRVITSETFDSNVADMSFELPATQGYYYVRVTQADKNIAVTAPVWIGQAPLVGISSLETDTKLPVTDEELNLTTTLFNNEENAVTVESISYSIDGELLVSKTLGTEIVTGGTLADVVAYTPTTASDKKVIVTAVVTVDGQEKTFTSELLLDVLASEKLVYVGIDASHFNEYVAGNYKDSMGNFADMAVEYNVRVVELGTEAELIAATNNPKFKMLVLTPPTRRNGNNFLIGYKSYSPDVIAAVQKFAESGGTLVVTGWADYYENYTSFSDGTPHTLPASEDMSAQQNSLLEAIGSTLRVSDDEIRDDVTNGGQSQRLYLTEYNLNNVFLNGVKADEQVYSNYGGSTIYGIDQTSNPSDTLESSVSPMVYAFETSYSQDEDGDGTTDADGVLVPKYDNKYLVAASETLSHENGKSSTVIVAGSAFMSNFEIQVVLDSYATPEYSNYTILENVVRNINPVVISTIAEVQAADEGVEFTIQGIVTSNASGYDKDTAFFDCIYLQDATAGINAFPVAEVIQAGQKVEITGKTSSYNGERQIFVESVRVIDETVNDLPDPIELTVGEAEEGSDLGSLVTISGKVESIVLSNGIVESIYVKHGKNLARIFIDGYITSTKSIPGLAVGKTVIATGLSSIDTEGTRIRIRDRADVLVLSNSSTNNPKVITDDPVVIAPEPIPEAGTDEATIDTTVVPEGTLDTEVPDVIEDEPLPKTGGVPIEVISLIGIFSMSAGITLRKRKFNK